MTAPAGSMDRSGRLGSRPTLTLSPTPNNSIRTSCPTGIVADAGHERLGSVAHGHDDHAGVDRTISAERFSVVVVNPSA